MKKILCVALCMVTLLLMTGCSATMKDEMFALDTVISFNVYAKYEAECENFIKKSKKEIQRLEALLSAHDEDSDIYKINHSDGQPVKVSEETAEIIRTALEVSKATDGAFDVSVYGLMKIWGFDTKNYRVPTDKEIQEALKKTGYENIEITEDNFVTVKNGATIDLGGIAKGYIVNKVISQADPSSNWNYHGCLINAGGMVMVVGKNMSRDDHRWIIGVEYPDSNGDYFATFTGGDAVTAGAYQRYFEKDSKKYHHIIDPKTGAPCESDLSSVTVSGVYGAKADALSTAFYVMGKEKTLEFVKNYNQQTDEYNMIDVILLSKDKKDVYVTENMLVRDFELEESYKEKITVHAVNNK